MLQKIKTISTELFGIPRRILESAKELNNLYSISGGAMLTAVSVVLNQFTLFLTQVIRLSFTFLPLGLSGMLYGPMLTGAMGAIADILKYFTRNDGASYFPGFTLSAFVVGFLYGIFFYKQKITLPRVIAARVTVVVIESLLLNPLWLSIIYKQAFLALVSARIVKNIVMLPIEVAMLYFVLKKLGEVYQRSRIAKGRG